jgi:hypothetical protein
MGFRFVVMFIDSFMDDVTYARDVEGCMYSMICYIPGRIGYGSENFGVGSVHDDLNTGNMVHSNTVQTCRKKGITYNCNKEENLKK